MPMNIMPRELEPIKIAIQGFMHENKAKVDTDRSRDGYKTLTQLSREQLNIS